MKFGMKTPCTHCPFRTDVTPFLRPAWAREILSAIVDRDGTFPCHKTIGRDEDGEYVRSDGEQHCAGASILLEKIERPNQLMRIAERFGDYDRNALDMDAPVYDTPRAMIAAYNRAKP